MVWKMGSFDARKIRRVSNLTYVWLARQRIVGTAGTAGTLRVFLAGNIILLTCAMPTARVMR